MTISEDVKHELIGYGIVFTLAIIIVAIFTFFISGLSGDTKKRAENVLVALTREEKAFRDAETLYQKEKTMGYFPAIASHEADEAWLSYFDETRQTFSQLDTIKTELEKLLDKDASKDQETVNEYVFVMNRQLENIQAAYRYPLQRISIAKELQEKTDATIHQIFLNYHHAKTSMEILHSQKNRDENTKILPVAKYLLREMEKVKEETEKLERQSTIDLLDLYDAQQTARSVKQKLIYLLSEKSPFSSELLSSKSMILIDMKSRYFFTPIRYSWNSSSDYSDNTYVYSPIEIGYEQYKTLQGQEDSMLGSGNGNSAFFEMNGQALFDMKEQWPYDSTDAEYWILDITPKYYHRYAVFSNDRLELSDWVEVSETLFYRHLPHYGMAISSKPYGYLSAEAFNDASPPAIAFVDNPLYGQWDDKEWHFYPAYNTVFSPYMLSKHYTRDEYDAWKQSLKRHHDFYGKTVRYGTRSPILYKSPTFINSDFVRLYIDLVDLHHDKLHYKGILHENDQNDGSGGGSGGFGGSSYSAKNAGRSLKGGGPGGYGK